MNYYKIQLSVTIQILLFIWTAHHIIWRIEVDASLVKNYIALQVLLIIANMCVFTLISLYIDTPSCLGKLLLLKSVYISETCHEYIGILLPACISCYMIYDSRNSPFFFTILMCGILSVTTLVRIQQVQDADTLATEGIISIISVIATAICGMINVYKMNSTQVLLDS